MAIITRLSLKSETVMQEKTSNKICLVFNGKQGCDYFKQIMLRNSRIINRILRGKVGGHIF